MNIIEQHWKEILDRVREEHEMTFVSFDTWLKPLKVHRFENGTVFILVPSTQQMHVTYISKKYLLPIKIAIAEVTGVTCEIEFILPEDVDREEAKKQEIQKTNPNLEKTNLNPRYTFSTFVVFGRSGVTRRNL